MMSIQEIVANNKKATNKAKRHKSVPFIFGDKHLEHFRSGEISDFKNIPLLGDYVPHGWKLVCSHFVDASGLGAPDEPALTQKQFAKVVVDNPNHGWGLGEWGQFQVYINEYERE